MNTKKGRAYRFNMEINLKPDRQAYLIDVLLMLTRRNLQDLSEILQIAAKKLVDVHRNLDYLNKKEIQRVMDLLVILYEN